MRILEENWINSSYSRNILIPLAWIWVLISFHEDFRRYLIIMIMICNDDNDIDVKGGYICLLLSPSLCRWVSLSLSATCLELHCLWDPLRLWEHLSPELLWSVGGPQTMISWRVASISDTEWKKDKKSFIIAEVIPKLLWAHPIVWKIRKR